ncbi:carcinoembryonic antigen-related cell adhesion molecule 21-like [Artibeus jamaicensis]|uniref:carcinoembryonic antigen-related cell adhesion molecule 21-like n=1 Tax=Artibeus jamaicensis TaxID=9417 RepID=UPI00235AA52E|nr:carcinoembryonic antigen-related cell adhesion molecule 21-like [Artibeus jamaicensis]
MGSLSVSTHRGLAHWQGLMLAGLLLTIWSLPTTEQLNIVSTFSAKGEDVVLHISSKPQEAVAFVWYKGEGVDRNNVIAFFIPTSSFYLSGPQNNKRQIITEDGSLLLKQVTMMDAGMYTIVAHFPDSETEIGFGQLDVYEPLKVPVLLVSSYELRENEDDVVLTCYTNAPIVQWLFNDRKTCIRTNCVVNVSRSSLQYQIRTKQIAEALLKDQEHSSSLDMTFER